MQKYSFPKSKIKVLLLENIDKVALENFAEEGYEVETVSRALSEEELMKKIKGVFLLGIRSKTQVTKKVLESADKLLALGAFCIGINQVDVLQSSKLGIPVFNAPYSNTRSVVELIIGETIALSRRIFDKSTLMHAGEWQKGSKNCHELRGKSLGIIGYGNIGSQLSVLAENLGMNVYYYDVAEKLSLGNSTSCKNLNDLLKKSDIVTVHVDGRSENKNLIGKKQFVRMKKGVIFLNASRGFVVDIKALYSAIKNGKVSGAAIDVFPEEPKTNGKGFQSILRGLPNVILTPHIGAGTEEAQKNIAEYLSKKLIQFVNTGSTTLSVGFPQIQMSEFRKVHRLIHIHKNVPGVLAKINKILADNRINIEGQYLKTNENIGYVITDVDTVYSKPVLKLLKDMPESVRVRELY